MCFQFFSTSCYVTSRIWIRSDVSRSDPDPVQNGPDPQHCPVPVPVLFTVPVPVYIKTPVLLWFPLKNLWCDWTFFELNYVFVTGIWRWWHRSLWAGFGVLFSKAGWRQFRWRVSAAGRSVARSSWYRYCCAQQLVCCQLWRPWQVTLFSVADCV